MLTPNAAPGQLHELSFYLDVFDRKLFCCEGPCRSNWSSAASIDNTSADLGSPKRTAIHAVIKVQPAVEDLVNDGANSLNAPLTLFLRPFALFLRHKFSMDAAMLLASRILIDSFLERSTFPEPGPGLYQ